MSGGRHTVPRLAALMGWALGAALLVLPAIPAGADAPRSSVRPEAREATPAPVRAAPAQTRRVATQAPATQAATQTPTQAATQTTARATARATQVGTQVFVAPRPKPRPRAIERRAARAEARAQRAADRAARAAAGTSAATAAQTAAQTAAASAAAVQTRPAERPRGLGSLFRRAAQPAPPVRGSVCGNREIRGTAIAPIGNGGGGGCGIANPVRITEVAGIKLSTPATIDCPTAQAFHTWLTEGAKPAVGRRGGGLAAVQVAAHYACRTRNNQRGARLSEHAKGRAIDISALVFSNGQRVTVLHGWRSSENGPMMRQMHRAACGPFGTVLGPNADRFHQDHFHFDTARYRSGPYCR